VESRFSKAAIYLVAVAMIAVLVWVSREALFNYDSSRELREGETFTMTNGLTLRVPPRYSGHHYSFYRVPEWLPLGQSAKGDTLSDEIYIYSDNADIPRGSGGDFMSYYGSGRRRKWGMSGGTQIASAPGVTAFAFQSEPRMFRLELALPDHDAGVVLASTPSSVTPDAVRAWWREFVVSGAPEPR
jgi:hypothetical protein